MSTTDNPSTVSPPHATRREWIGLAVIALPALLYSMDLTVLFLAVPQLTADLEPSSTQLLWIVDIYGFMVAGFLITMGTLGDRIGRRRLLLIGAAAFGAASMLAAFSTSATMLIAARALLGIAGATLAPSTLSLIRNMFLDPKERTAAIGIWAASFSVGAAIGPLIGGLLLEFFWWGSVFLVAVPVMALLLIVGQALLPEFRDPKAGKLDPLSAILSLSAVLSVIYAIKRFSDGSGGWVAVAFGTAGLLLGTLFALRQLRLAYPFMDLKLFRRPAFSGALGTNTFSALAAFGTLFLTAQYLQLVLGLTPLQAGLWTLPSSTGFIIGSLLAPTLVNRYRPGKVIPLGLLVAAVGLAALALIETADPLVVFVATSIVFSVGFALVITLTTDLIVGTAPPERAGAASSMSETADELGGALGIAILGSVGSAVYRSSMAGSVPEAVPPAAAEVARDNLGGAVAVAGNLTADIGNELLEVSRLAFTDGLQTVAMTGAVIAAILAIVATRLLRNVRHGGGEGDPDIKPAGAEVPPP